MRRSRYWPWRSSRWPPRAPPAPPSTSARRPGEAPERPRGGGDRAPPAPPDHPPPRRARRGERGSGGQERSHRLHRRVPAPRRRRARRGAVRRDPGRARAVLRTQTGADDARLTLDLLSRDSLTGLDLLADLALRPRFEPEEVAEEEAPDAGPPRARQGRPRDRRHPALLRPRLPLTPLRAPGSGDRGVGHDLLARGDATPAPGVVRARQRARRRGRLRPAAGAHRRGGGGFGAWPRRDRPAAVAAAPRPAGGGEVLLLDKPWTRPSRRSAWVTSRCGGRTPTSRRCRSPIPCSATGSPRG